jgi:hypothetical protein
LQTKLSSTRALTLGQNAPTRILVCKQNPQRGFSFADSSAKNAVTNSTKSQTFPRL